MMRRKTAAAYLDMTEAAFEREIVAGRLPSGVTLGGRLHWRKECLDKALARLAGEGDDPDYLRELKERYGKAA
jgi:hypothetical protein